MKKSKGKEKEEEGLEGSDHISEFGTPKFNVDANYSSNYLGNIYESESYHHLSILNDDVRQALDKMVKEMPQYDKMRKMDVEKLKSGDMVQLIREKKVVELISYEPPHAKIKVDEDVEEVPTYNIEPAENPVIKLKAFEIREIYEGIKKHCKSRSYEEMNFFYVFSEYFKINEKVLFNSLPTKIKVILANELDESSGSMKKRGIKQMW